MGLINTLQIALVAMAAFVWLAILLVPWQPWRNNLVLKVPPPDEKPADLDDVTVVIPARDEARLITRTLSALAAQGENLHVVLVDDNSSDGTAERAREVLGLDLRLVSGKPLPSGWSGKVWALEQGVREVRTPLTLMIDADIQLDPGVIAALMAHRQRGYQLVSVMATLHMRSAWEKLLMPAFIYFFKMLYPFGLANSENRRFASAAGGCILIETRLFDEIGGLEAIKGAVIDDCALAARVKRAGFRSWTGQSRQVSSIRHYQSLKDIWDMIARTAYTQLSYSPFILLLCTFGLLLLFFAPLWGLFNPDATVRLLGLAGWLAMIASYLSTLHFYSLSPAWALLLPLTGGLYLAMTWSSAVRYWRGERTRWKGRVYN
jgi:hopene-associated glycosyltransferase HpnB